MPSGVVTVTSDSVTATALATCGSIIAMPAPSEDAELPPRHQSARLVLLSIVFKMILIAHMSLLLF